ncbi:MAG: baseplate J/gp47 family protein [Actinomycetota bacterium]
MSFASEPYGAFVDDLVRGLTGGIVRERFTFLPEQEPFQLGHADVIADTVQIRGLAHGVFKQFSPVTDFDLTGDRIDWKSDGDGQPSAEATWPDRGTLFWASYERTPDPQRPPRLTDRNPGSITRTLAESFAREFAVVSTQLDTVHKAAFVETATGDDLDQLALLVGLERRGKTFAQGEVVFARPSPAPADVFIQEGTRLSTNDVPAITVETTEDRRLRAGSHSVAAPVRAVEQGTDGVAGQNTVVVLHRPILGVASVANPEPLTFGAGETDEELRRRIQRALASGGRATIDAIVGALTSLEDVREQDVLLVEDHLGFPGLVKVTIAAELEEAEAREAARLIDAHRPAGVRFVHNLPLPAELGIDPGTGGGGGGDGPIDDAPEALINENRFPIKAKATVTPATADLTATEKQALIDDVAQALTEAVDDAGIEERVIYNRVVAAAMAVDGVYDVVLDLIPVGSDAVTGKVNLSPTAETRADLEEVDITLQGALVAIDVTVNIELVGAGLLNPVGEREQARDAIRAELVADLPTLNAGPAPHLTAGTFETLLDNTDTYVIDSVSYRVEFIDEGLRVQRSNADVTLQADQQVWLRTLTVLESLQTEGT